MSGGAATVVLIDTLPLVGADCEAPPEVSLDTSEVSINALRTRSRKIQTRAESSELAETTSHSALEAHAEWRSVLTAAASQMGYWDVLRVVGSTPIRFVLEDPAMVCAVLIYVIVRFVAIYLRSAPLSNAFSLGAVTAVGGICYFILVFFMSQSYTRMLSVWSSCCTLQGRTLDVVLLLQQSRVSAPVTLRVWRYINTAHILGYTAIPNSCYTYENLFEPFDVKYGLLHNDELERLEEIGMTSDASVREVLSWIMFSIGNERRSGTLGESEAYLINEVILHWKAASGAIFAQIFLPFPFMYVSFVRIIVFLYPVLFALTVALSFDTIGPEWVLYWPHELTGAFCVLLNSFTFVGLFKVAMMLQDPLGLDDVDLNVFAFVRFALDASAKILSRKLPSPPDDAFELNHHSNRMRVMPEAFWPRSTKQAAHLS